MDKFSKWRAEKKRIREINAEGWDGYDWDENQPKWPLTRILKVGFNTIAVIIWAIILIRIFTSGNDKYEKMILLNDSAAQIALYASENSCQLNAVEFLTVKIYVLTRECGAIR